MNSLKSSSIKRPSTSNIKKGFNLVENNEILLESSRINSQLSTQTAFSTLNKKIPFSKIPTSINSTKIIETLDQPFNFSTETKQSYFFASEEERKNNPNLIFDLLKTMTPKNCIKYLENNSVFLKSFVQTGKLDPILTSNVALTLTQNELQKFMSNMTYESNIYSIMVSNTNIFDLENKLLNYLPINQLIIWNVIENFNYIYSESLKIVVPINKTLFNEVFNNKNDLIINLFHNNNYNFSNFDHLIFKEDKSIYLLPIKSKENEIISILQISGFKDLITNLQIEFNSYFLSIFNLIKDFIFEKYFSTIIIPNIPESISNIYKNIEKNSINLTSNYIILFLNSIFSCESSEIFEFNEKNKELIRLNDNKIFNKDNGGISYYSTELKYPIIVPSGFESDFNSFNNDIDKIFSNTSILSYCNIHKYHKFVFTLRNKINQPIFNNYDINLLKSLFPIISNSILLSQFIQKNLNLTDEIDNDLKLYKIVTDSLKSISELGKDKKNVLEESCQKFFGTSIFFICHFDGRYMKFDPSSIIWKFEDCAAGKSYNSREIIITNIESEWYNKELYNKLGIDLKKSISFPYKIMGRVAGAIEIINPTIENISNDLQIMFNVLCGSFSQF